MRFYDLLQLDPHGLKAKIRTASNASERHRLRFALLVRALLLVAFAIAFIAGLSVLFGSENTPLAVVLFCLFLSFRFVPLGYTLKQEPLALAILFVLLWGAPALAAQLPPLGSGLIHGISLWLLIGLTCLNFPQVHGGLMGFAYVYLAGNPVWGASLTQRGYLALLGWGLCWAIIVYRHRDKESQTPLCELFSAPFRREASLQRRRFEHWRLRLTLALAFLLTLGSGFALPRLIWAGFACSCLLAPYDLKQPAWSRLRHRLLGALEGCLLFYILQGLIPPTFQGLLGPLGGVCLGLCTHYRHQSCFNTLGALLAASLLYPAPHAMALRMLNTLIGLGFALLIIGIEQVVLNRLPPPSASPATRPELETEPKPEL